MTRRSGRLFRRGVGPRVRAAIVLLTLAGAALAQTQMIGGRALDNNLRSGSMGLNGPVYRPGAQMGASAKYRAMGAGGNASNLYTPGYRQQYVPQQAYRWQTPGGAVTTYSGRAGMGTYVDPLASSMYNPLRKPVSIQRTDPITGRPSTLQVQPYGSGR